MRKIIFYFIITVALIGRFVLPVYAGMESDSYRIVNFLFSSGGGVINSDNYQIEMTLAEPLGFTSHSSENYVLYPGFWHTFDYNIIPLDSDRDGIPDNLDNCPDDPNAGQEDTYPPEGNNCGDACECEGDFDHDTDQDGKDAAKFKEEFGRSSFFDPCTQTNSCTGNFDSDQDVDGMDALKFKEDFGRCVYHDICPICVVVP